MNSITKFKGLVLLVCLFAYSFNVVANEKISLTWKATDIVSHLKSIGITATSGKQFAIDWGDGSDIETITATAPGQVIHHVYDVSPYNYIATITGATNDCFFTYFDCMEDQVMDLDLSECVSLQELWCNANSLTALDLSANMALISLDCSGNSLTDLDLSANTALKYLTCSYNSLINLDVSNNTELVHLECVTSQLTDLNVSNNPALKTLWCLDNQLTYLDLSATTALEDLWCHFNQLTTLDLSANTALAGLRCAYNQLTNLELGGITTLISLDCIDNHLPLSDLYAASQKITNPQNKSLGLQTLAPQEATGGLVDYSEQREFGGEATVFTVEKDGSPAPLHDYTVIDGIIMFYNIGDYIVTMTNPAIISNPGQPARVIVEITVIEPHANATLTDLAISEGVLTPAFSSNIFNYTVDVAFSVEEITITTTPTHPDATVNGDGLKPLLVGENPFTITVTADDGITQLEYMITVIREDEVGITESIQKTSNLTIYPNPTNGELIITHYRHCGLDPQFPENNEIAGDSETSSGRNDIKNVEIFDVMGRTVVGTTLAVAPDGTHQLQIGANAPAGIYFLRITTENGIVTCKIIHY